MRENVQLIIVFLLLLIVIGIGYLCYSSYKDNKIQPYTPPYSVLVLYSDSEDLAYSDSTQVDSALSYGGEIHIDILNTDVVNKSFGSDSWQRFGALANDDSFHVRGAVLNYIASYNWKLVQVTSNEYYFVR